MLRKSYTVIPADARGLRRDAVLAAVRTRGGACDGAGVGCGDGEPCRFTVDRDLLREMGDLERSPVPPLPPSPFAPRSGVSW